MIRPTGSPFNVKNTNDIFDDDRCMMLYDLTAPSISSSLSTIAKIETARRKDTWICDDAGRLNHVWKISWVDPDVGAKPKMISCNGQGYSSLSHLPCSLQF
jgi:hypothetical protein